MRYPTAEAVELKRSVRRRLIDIAIRRQRPGAGSPTLFLRRRTNLAQFPNPTLVLSNLRWAVIGGVATRLYMPERATQVLDVLVHPEDGEEVRRRLAAAGFRHQGELAVGGSSWTGPDGSYLDVIEMGAPWLSQALAEAQHNRDAQGMPVLPLPYLVLMKFQAGRVQDLADVARMLGQASPDRLQAVRQLFIRYQPDDIDDLESLIVLGQIEMNPPAAGGLNDGDKG